MVQYSGGPCAVLASVQVGVLIYPVGYPSPWLQQRTFFLPFVIHLVTHKGFMLQRRLFQTKSNFSMDSDNWRACSGKFYERREMGILRKSSRGRAKLRQLVERWRWVRVEARRL